MIGIIQLEKVVGHLSLILSEAINILSWPWKAFWVKLSLLSSVVPEAELSPLGQGRVCAIVNTSCCTWSSVSRQAKRSI